MDLGGRSESVFAIKEFGGYTTKASGQPGTIVDRGEEYSPYRSRGFHVDSFGKLVRARGWSQICQLFGHTEMSQVHGMHYWRGGGVGSTVILAGTFGLKHGRIGRIDDTSTDPWYYEWVPMTQIGPTWISQPSTDPGTNEGPAYLYGCFAEFRDRLYYCNGVDWPIRIDGLHHLFAKSTFEHSGETGPVYSAMGVFAPQIETDSDAFASIRSNYSGLRAGASDTNLYGITTYAVSVVSKYGESPATIVPPPSRDSVGASPEGTAPIFYVTDWSKYADYITAVRIYRLAEAHTVMQSVGDIPRGDYSLMDIQSDGELGYTVPTDTGLPSNFRLLATFEDRMFAVGGFGNPNRVACSKSGYPDVWPALYELKLSASLGTRMITQMKVLNGSLYLFLDEGILRMYGSSPENFGFSPVSEFIGCIAPKTMVPYTDGVVFLSKDGIYFFNGSQLRKVTDSLSGVVDGTTPGSMGWHRACGSAAREYYYLSYRDDGPRVWEDADSLPQAGDDPNRTYKINMTNGRVGVIDDWAFSLSTPYEGTESLVVGHKELIEATPSGDGHVAAGAYGDVGVRTYRDYTFTITNDSGPTSFYGNAAVTGTDSAQFEIQSGGGSFVLAEGESHSVVIRFTPNEVRDGYSATFSFGLPYVDTYSLSGDGVVPCTCAPTSHDYGNVTVGNTGTQDFTLTPVSCYNDLAIVILLSGDAEFAFEGSEGGAQTVPWDGTYVFTVEYSPDDAEANSANIVFTPSALEVPNVALSGTGVPP